MSSRFVNRFPLCALLDFWFWRNGWYSEIHQQLHQGLKGTIIQ